MRPASAHPWLVVAALVALTACAPKLDTPRVLSTEAVQSLELVARVKTALLNDAMVGRRRIDVQADGDRVQLSGRVASEVERDRAVAIARAVSGVASVTSALDIRP